MPVKLSRFVRVMSGGKIVTDELVAVRDGKVGAALDDLQAEIDRLGTVGLRLPVLEDTHRDLTQARVDANAETSNADKGAALEAAKFDARDAIATAKEQVDAALPTGGEKATKLGGVDAALLLARNAVTGIVDAALRAPLVLTADALKGRRDTLAGLSVLADVALELAKVPTLLADIGRLATDAGRVAGVAQAKADRLREVDAALLDLTTVEAGIAEAGFKAPVMLQVQALSLRRDALANAADEATAASEAAKGPALVGDIGTAAVAGRRAATAEAAQATQLGLVDTALLNLTNETAAISEAVYKAPVTLLMGPLALRRGALAAAADVATAETQIGLAPTLLLDLGAAVTQAQAAQRNATDLAGRRTAIDSYVATNDGWINTLKTASQAAFKARQDQLKLDRTALDTAAPAAIPAALLAMETEMRAVYRDVVAEAANQSKDLADEWAAAFAGWEKAIRAISPTNPVPTETAALRLEQQAAELLPDANARNTALNTFMTNAGLLQTKITDMQAAKKEIDLLGRTIEALLNPNPPPTVLPAALALERADVLAAIPGAFALASTDAVVARLATLKGDMQAIKPKAEDWRAAQIGLDALKLSVAKSLAEARVAIDTLGAGDPKTEMDGAQTALVLRQAATATMLEPAAVKALFAIDKEALALLEQAHKAALTAQLGAPDGKQKIDALITALGDKAANPQAEALCRAALAARFNLEVEILEGLSVDRLPRLYNLFAQVPAAHVGHDKLTKLAYNTDPNAEASYYSAGDKKIMLVMGQSDSSIPYTAQTGGAIENLNYFSATALHEIGHGVDEKQQIMSDGRMAGAEFGGWKKETIETVADAHYTASFASLVVPSGPTEADLRALVKTVLETGECTAPASATAALGSLFATWTTIHGSTGFQNCQKIRNPGVSPWDNPIPAGTRAYHEAYDGSWFSYLVAERAKGISNYQWRAPGEWFAELYAYYHMTKKAVPACVDAFIKG